MLNKREEIEILYIRIVIKPIEMWQSRKALANVVKKSSSDQ